MRTTAWVLVALALAGCAGGAEVSEPSPSAAGGEADAARTLDALHAAASRADGAAYFDLYTPDAVFLGTDPGERWTLEAFKAYAAPHFAKGQGWAYRVVERHVTLGPGGVAWFDERLQNAKLGECRGTGVLVWSGDRYRVAQYDLTVPIPNAMVVDVAARIRAQEKAR